MKILILASNPRKDLNLDDEIRLLRSVIARSRDRDQVEVVSEPGVRVGDLQGLLLRHKPQIVHFCGHGGGKEGLIFKREEGGEQWVRADALANMFGLNPICQHVQCVLLNACYSEEQASAIVSRIDYVVGMSHEIQDNAAIAFSKGFYLALGEGCSIEDSFEFGKNAIQLEISGSSSKMRSAATEQQRQMQVVDAVAKTAIPEHLKPILKKKDVLTFGSNYGAPAANASLSAEARVAIQVEVGKALEAEDSSLKQYRDRVREFLGDRKLSALEAIRLERLRKDLRLSEVAASQILAEELEPIQQGRDEYEAMLIGLIEAGHYPLDRDTEAELLAVRQELGLTDEEVEAIAPRILAAADKDYQRQRQQNHFVEDLGRNVTLEMVKIAGGTFRMGSPDHELRRSDDESPQHSVTLQPFWMGKFAVTQAQYQAIMGENPANFKGEKRPVEQVSWNEAVEFCDRLSLITGKKYRLPSEAEWEYACRAGTTTPFSCGETVETDLANYDGNYVYGSGIKGVYRKETTEVGSFPPNAFGLYEMHGNVLEWCADHSHENYQGAPVDGSAWIIGGNSDYRLMRGGSWDLYPWDCRSASRLYFASGDRNICLGFRVVCGLA
jgi:formylglycine-generating enzyme required for sulfatase activity